jgi:hypothetical protein
MFQAGNRNAALAACICSAAFGGCASGFGFQRSSFRLFRQPDVQAPQSGRSSSGKVYPESFGISQTGFLRALAVFAVILPPASCNTPRSPAERKISGRFAQSCIVTGILRLARLSAKSRQALTIRHKSSGSDSVR